MSTEFGVATNVLKSTTDKMCLSILPLLRDGETSVTAIVNALNRPIPAISQHLAKLHMANTMQARKEGASSFYPQPDEHLTNLVVNAFRFAEHTFYSNPSHRRV